MANTTTVTYTKSTNPATGLDTFTGSFTFPKGEGLVRVVHDRTYPDSCTSGPIEKFTVKRSVGRDFRIECTTGTHPINTWENYPSCPFWFDSNMQLGTLKKEGGVITADEIFGGGNRVLVDLRPTGGTLPSNYTIYVPDGFQLEVQVDAELLDFKKRRCTLHASGKKVNRVGYSGSCGGGMKSEWSYSDFGSRYTNDPPCKLVNTGAVVMEFSNE